MRKLRLIADQKEGPDAVLAVQRHALARVADLGITAGTIVAGYWPLATEIDIRPLLARLDERGAACALPAIVADSRLAFRRWRPADTVEQGPRGTWHPPATASVVEPEVLFVPLLAIDDDGFRLGQGGGYYDRVLADLRAQRKITAIGVGYALQHVARLPRDRCDQPVDWLLTEQGLQRVPV